MEKRKKINKHVKIFVSLMLVLILLYSIGFSYAWFSDKKSFSTNELKFGTIKLNVSGGVDSTTSTLVFDTARKTNNDGSWTGRYMPGDTINIKLKVGLEEGSSPAYYIVQISDDKNIFENAYYYSQDGTNVFVNNGQKIYKQDSTSTATTPIIGKLSAGDSNAHSLTISAKISEDFEERNLKTEVRCGIFAVQTANLEEQSALNELLIGASEDNRVYTELNYIESTGTQSINTGVAINSTITDYSLETEVMWTDTSKRQLMGYSGTQRGYFGVESNGCYELGCVKSSISASTTSFDNVIIFRKDTEYKLIVNNDENSSITTTNDDKVGSYYLFSLCGGWRCCARMKSCKITIAGEVVRDFIPCLRNADNKPGLYDLVSGKFFTNEGSGEFVYA